MSTSYCGISVNRSNFTWDYLSDVFSYGLKQSELGITFAIIHDITRFYSHRRAPAEVYVAQTRLESLRGADLDLYVENANGGHDFYRLQAKIMDHQGVYTISRWGPRAQFNDLIREADNNHAMPLYLFYNGSTPNSNLGNDNFGLSIVHAERIKTFRRGQHGMRYAPRPNFNTFFANMLPMSALFCGGLNGGGTVDFFPKGYKKPAPISRKTVYDQLRGYANVSAGLDRQMDRDTMYAEFKQVVYPTMSKFKVIIPFSEAKEIEYNEKG